MSAKLSRKTLERPVKRRSGKNWITEAERFSAMVLSDTYQVEDVIIYRNADILWPELRLHFDLNGGSSIPIPDPVKRRKLLFDDQAFITPWKRDKWHVLPPVNLYIPFYYFDFEKFESEHQFGYLTERWDVYRSKKFPGIVVENNKDTRFIANDVQKARAQELFIRKNEAEAEYLAAKARARASISDLLAGYKAQIRALKHAKLEKLGEILPELEYLDPLKTIERNHDEILTKMSGG